jgi:PAS domain S-box-containing protein
MDRREPFPARVSRLRLDLLLQIGAGAGALIAAAFVAFLLSQARQRTLAEAAVTTQNLGHLLDEVLTASFDKVELALTAVRDEVDRQAAEGRPQEAALLSVMARQRERAPDLLAVRLLDTNGNVGLSVPPTDGAHSVADREYFEALRDGAPWVISKPVSGRIVHTPILVFGRRLEAPDGAFRGAVIGVIELDHVARILARLDVGVHGVVVLRADDLRVVARTDTHGPRGVLDTSAVSEELKRLVASGQLTATYEALAPSDRTRRVLTFRRLDHHPFYIIVGLALDDQLAGWRHEALTATVLLVSFLVVLCLGAVLVARALRRQRSAEERLAATIQSIGEGVIAIDVGGRVLFMNGVAERLCGWSAAEARGRLLEEVYHLVERRSRGRVPSAAAQALAADGGVEPTGRLAVITRGGAQRAVVETGAPIRDAAGVTSGAVLVFRDVTDQERAEEELARIQRLESLAVLAGGIAHDFNNLLTGITGNLSLAQEDAAAGSAASEALADAQAAAQRARSLTHQLLTFSHGGAPVKSRIDLSSLVQEVARFAAHGAGTALRFDLVPDLTVEADRGQLGQVVQNLVINGIQAMGSSGTLELATRRDGAGGTGGGQVELTVTDSGPGIPADVLPRIFDPFFTTKAQGTGLGLAICHSIVTRHGGSIVATSPPGQGATFRVTLPASGARQGRAGGAEGEPVPPRAAGQRVLVMDDEEAVRRLAERALRPQGLEVVGARDGAEALALYREALSAGRRFAAVVMDLTVPGGMGGLEAMEHLRALDPGVVAIVSSGYSNDPVMADASHHGFRAVLAKPYAAGELREVLSQALREGAGGREREAPARPSP